MTEQTLTEDELNRIIQTVVINATPETLDALGIVVDPETGVVNVVKPRKLRKEVERRLQEQMPDVEKDERLRRTAQSFTRGASKTGEVVALTLVDRPIEGIRFAGQATKSVARNTRSKFSAAHQRRLDNAETRRKARQARKASKREQELRDDAAELQARINKLQKDKEEAEARAEAQQQSRVVVVKDKQSTKA